MTSKGEKAKTLFESGYNCAQSVLGAFSEETGLDFETSVKIASGFGGGLGRQREVCGAVTGMCMAADLIYGYTNPKAAIGKADTYKMVQELSYGFKDINGSIICRQLLGLEKPEGTHIPEERTDLYYKKRPCGDLVKIAADILEEYIKENPLNYKERTD